MNKNQFIDWLASLDNLARPLYPSQAQEVAGYVFQHTEEQVIEEADRAVQDLIAEHARRQWQPPDPEEIVRAIVRHLTKKGMIYAENAHREGLEVAEGSQPNAVRGDRAEP